MRTEAEFSTATNRVRRPPVSCDCHAVLDLEGRFLSANEDFAGVLDAGADALVGEDLERFIDAETPRAVLDDLWRALSVGTSWSAVLQVRSLLGAVHWMRLTVVPDTHRGVAKAYLAQLRPAFGAEIEHAQAAFAEVANGAVFDDDQARAKGFSGWRRLSADARLEPLTGVAVILVLLSLAVLVTLALRPEAGAWLTRALVSGLASLLALAGIGVIVLERRQRKREYLAVCGLIDRIGEGDTDAGGIVFRRVGSGVLRDALRRLQLKLAIAAYRGAARKADSVCPEASVSPSPTLAARLRLVEARCAELVALSRRTADLATATAPGEMPIVRRLTALSEGVVALQSSLQSLALTSRQARVLGLNLGLLEARTEINGVARLHRAAKSVACEAADCVTSLERGLVQLQRELDALIELMPARELRPQSIAATVGDELASLLEALRGLRSTVEPGHHGPSPVSDVTLEARDSAYAHKVVHNPEADAREAKKVQRLKAVGTTPVPRVGRGKRGGPLEEDWRD